MKQKREESFTGGVALLTISAVIVKLIGVCYKIPLVNLLGAQGMGYFNAAYDVYALLCVVSTAGLPTAVSILMSKYGDMHKRIFRFSISIFAIIGAIGSIAVFFMADYIAVWIKAPGAAQSLRFIAPSILFICLSGAYRGYHQGTRNMKPTAISQIIEAAGKLAFGLVFAYIALYYQKEPAIAAAFAVLGLSVGTLLCMLYLMSCCKMQEEQPCNAKISTPKLLEELFAIAFPITVGAVLSGLSKLIDLGLIMRRLQDAGMTQEIAVSMYGCYSSMVIPLFTAVPALLGSLSMPLVAHLSHAISTRDTHKQTEILNAAFCMSALISVPSAIGMGMLSDQILQFLFQDSAELQMAVPLLIVMSVAIPASCLITVTNAILQAYGHPWIPMISTAAGSVIKAITLYALTVKPQVGIMAAPYSTLMCCTVIVLINLISIAKITPQFSFSKPWAVTTVVSVVSVSVAAVIKRVVISKTSSVIGTVLITVAVAVLLYGFLMYLCGLPQKAFGLSFKNRKG